MSRRNDSNEALEFLQTTLQTFLSNKDLEGINVSTDFGQIILSRNVKRKGEVKAIGFQIEEEETFEEEGEEKIEGREKKWKR